MESLQNDVAALKARDKKKEKTGGGFNRFDDEDSSGSNNRHFRPHNKMDFPTFSDGDPRGWVLKAEKYFRYYNIPEDEKVDVATMHFEGDALDFYSWLSTDQAIEFWDELVHALHKNFGPAEFQNPDEHLCNVRQTGTVQEYRQEFAKRSSRVSNWPEHCLLGVFLNGLKEELKADVRIHKPRTVYKAMSIALEFESKFSHTLSGKTIKSTGVATTDSRPAYSSNVNQVVPVQKPTENRLSDAEKQSRYLKGECFRCGDKYGPGHRCKTGTFKLLEITNEEGAAENEQECTDELAKISLHALFGQTSLTTMKLRGHIDKAEILVLIDSGSTHNFISDKLVSNLNLVTHFISPFGVQIGNGDVLKCNRICKNLVLQIANLQIKQDFHPFDLGGADAVLGIQWLATLNTVQANWKEMFLQFTINGKEYKLMGLPPNLQPSATFNHFTIEPFEEHTSGPAAQLIVTQLEDKLFSPAGSIDTKPMLGQTGPGQIGSEQLRLDGGKRGGGKIIGGKKDQENRGLVEN
uniref:Putative retrotransposon gag domain, Retroviral aspartyl protease n=1 Tax=Helianthus annuus TaxID=4232 RepID=A0A251UI76_HELAN